MPLPQKRRKYRQVCVPFKTTNAIAITTTWNNIPLQISNFGIFNGSVNTDNGISQGDAIKLTNLQLRAELASAPGAAGYLCMRLESDIKEPVTVAENIQLWGYGAPEGMDTTTTADYRHTLYETIVPYQAGTNEVYFDLNNNNMTESTLSLLRTSLNNDPYWTLNIRFRQLTVKCPNIVMLEVVMQYAIVGQSIID
jgi:hypothetical protein